MRPLEGGSRLVIECTGFSRPAQLGASIAINGVCLTVVEAAEKTLAFDIIPETLSRSNLGALRPGDMVNIEPSLRLGDPLDGHIVYGHVDSTTPILRKAPEPPGFRLWCSRPEALAPMIVEKGYVALDGTSLTVAGIAEDGASFAVALIPETLKRTTLGAKGEGEILNLEVDPIARYVQALLSAQTHARPASASAN